MDIAKKIKLSEWRPVSDLKQIEENISGFGYSKEFIDKNRLHDKKSPHMSNMITGQVDFFEPIKVKEDGGVALYCENEEHVHIEQTKFFKTQYGIFNNHNNGEFYSWLGKDDWDGLPKKKQEAYDSFERGDFLIEGNFCDMFDYGEYTYAISNLMHMGLGSFKIVRISKNLEWVVMYDNFSLHSWTYLKYNGRFENEYGCIIIASGFSELNPGQNEKRYFQDKTFLFQIDNNGNCGITQEREINISSPNSIAVLNGFVYFGQNKMVTRLNLTTGEVTYFTNKSDAELAALKKMW